MVRWLEMGRETGLRGSPTRHEHSLAAGKSTWECVARKTYTESSRPSGLKFDRNLFARTSHAKSSLSGGFKLDRRLSMCLVFPNAMRAVALCLAVNGLVTHVVGANTRNTTVCIERTYLPICCTFVRPHNRRIGCGHPKRSDFGH